MTTGKVLKERRAHRERGRTGSSLTPRQPRARLHLLSNKIDQAPTTTSQSPSRTTMLRKTASTLWTRFVPAARQAYPAAASSMKRVRHRSRAIARVSARAMRLRFFFLIASLTLSRLSNHPIHPQPRWFSATTEDGGEDGGEDVEEYEDDEEEWEYDEHAVRRTPRHRHRARLRRPSTRRRRRRSRAVRLFFPAAPAQPVRPPRAVRLRGVHRREQGRRLGESPVRDQDGARPRNSSDAASRRQLRSERSTSTREKQAKPRPSRFRRLVCLPSPRPPPSARL